MCGFVGPQERSEHLVFSRSLYSDWRLGVLGCWLSLLFSFRSLSLPFLRLSVNDLPVTRAVFSGHPLVHLPSGPSQVLHVVFIALYFDFLHQATRTLRQHWWL